MSEQIEMKLGKPGAKKFLSIDGGGIRGVLPLQILKEIENIVIKYNPSCECLGDYFDFIGGTSTGSIIATGLAIGMKVDEILEVYTKHGNEIFHKIELTEAKLQEYLKPSIDGALKALSPPLSLFAKPLRGWVEKSIPKWIRNYLKSKNMDDSLLLQLIYGWQYDHTLLEKQLKEKFGDLTLGSEKLKTLLMIVTKNATTGQPYFFVNNPRDPEFKDIYSKIMLRDIVRASSAAPTYFSPHSFKVGNDEFEFIDGGMSSFNNPSFMLFLQAVTNQFGINWSSGEDNLLMISVGTGFSQQSLKWDEKTQDYMKAKDYKLTDWGEYAIGTLMEDANIQENLIMKLIGQKVGKKTTSRKYATSTTYIDNWDFPEVTKDGEEKWLKYRRYSCSLTKERFNQLKERFGLELTFDLDNREKIERINHMDCTDMIEDLCAIGAAVAKEQVRESHFEGFTENPINP